MSNGNQGRITVTGIAGTVVLVIAAFLALFPLYWMAATSLKSSYELLSAPTALLPASPAWSNYAEAWRSSNFARQMFNSFFVALSVCFAQIVTSAMAGYCLARLRPRGGNVVFFIFLMTIMLPFQTLVVPVFVMLAKVGWIDTYQALILPTAANAFGIYLFRQFFLSLPVELEEAALVDGASRWTILWNVLFPLARPAATTVFLLTFVAEWNDLFKPLILTNSQDMRTVQLGLSVFQEQFMVEYALLMAAVTIVSLPVFGVFLAAQKRLISAFSTAGLKG